MKKFHFSLDKVLSVREIRKSLSEEEFLLANGEREKALDRLNEAIQLHGRARGEVTGSLSGEIDPRLVRDRILFERWALSETLRKKDDLSRAEEVVRTKRMELLVRTRDHKVLENLKRRRFKEYREAYFWQEGKTLDEIAVLGFVRREKGGEK